MESSDKLNEINTTNCNSYYLDDLIEIKDFDSNKILLDEKSYKHYFTYDISNKMELYNVLYNVIISCNG